MSKVGEVLKFGDRGISVEAARKAMLEAGEAPQGIAGELKKNEKAGFVPPPVAAAVVELPDLEEMLPPDGEEAAVTETKHVVVPPPAPKKDVVSDQEETTRQPKVERFENDKFVCEIRQEGGKWTAEINYKNGAGAEKWVRGTKSELMNALLEGKANATLKIREQKRRENLGVELDKAYPLPSYVTAEKFAKMDEEQQRDLIETIAAQQSILFKEEHPEYVKSERNGNNINAFMKKHNLPFTAKNLKYAFNRLLEDDELDVKQQARTEAPVQTSLATPVATQVTEDSVPAPKVIPPTSVEEIPEGTVVQVRKRGSSGMQPGHSSLPSGEQGRPEDGGRGKDLSEAELRKLSPIGKPVSKDLRAAANAERIAIARSRG